MKLKKSLGQHILKSTDILKKIVDYADIQEGEVVVEIGPGLGALTKFLLEKPLKKLYLLEIDKEMVDILKKDIIDERLVIIHTDARYFNYRVFEERSLKVLGNLPYNVASIIVENVVYYFDIVPSCFFLVQKEVAEKWHSGKSWLSVFIRTFYDINYLMSIPPRFFYPPPKVDSALIQLNRNLKKEIKDLKEFKKFLTLLFQMKRKMLRKKISLEILRRAQINEELRVDELSLEEILRLYEAWRD